MHTSYKLLLGKTFVYDHWNDHVTPWQLRADLYQSKKSNQYAKYFKQSQRSVIEEVEFLRTQPRREAVSIVVSHNNLNRKTLIRPRGVNCDFSPLLKFIKNLPLNKKQINIIPLDVFDNDEDFRGNQTQASDTLIEFALHNQISNCFTKTQVNMFHYNNKSWHIPQVKYCHPYAWWTIGRCLDHLPKTKHPVKKKLSCLINTARPQRSLLAVLLSDFDCVLTHNSQLKRKHVDLSVLHDPAIVKKAKANIDSACDRFCTDRPISGDLNHSDHALVESLNLISSAFCDIATEDPFCSAGARISEKTIKPIAVKRAFLLCAPSGTIKWLRQQGFRTFDKWWDESYDDELDHVKRLEKIYKIAETINAYSLDELKEMLNQMEPVLEHNFKHLQIFKNKTVENIW